MTIDSNKNSIRTGIEAIDLALMSDDIERLGIGRLEASYGPHNRELLKRLLPVRADFVDAMNWTRSDNDGQKEVDEYVLQQLPWLAEMSEQDRRDVDAYDTLESTMHFALFDRDTDSVIASLRLTKVASVEDSKSWAMLGDVLAKDAKDYDDGNLVARLNESAMRGNLYDLTRLVCPLDGSVKNKDLVAGIMELFAVGYGTIRKNTTDQHQADVRWICAATDLVKVMAENLCLDFAAAASGRVSPEDAMDTHFCVVRVEETVTNIAQHAEEPRFQFPAQHMFDGFQKASL